MNIYILAPMNRTSGGPELAHQLCAEINRQTIVGTERLSDLNPDYSHIHAFMCYVDVQASFDKALAQNTTAPAAYEEYQTEHVTSLAEMDQPDNYVIFPEGLTLSMSCIHQAKKILWWMSVDNYIVSTKEQNLQQLRDEVCLHLFQSEYSRRYVTEKLPDAEGMVLSDYINQQHGKFIYPAEYRENIALYNPAKGYDELKPLIDKSSDWLRWIPLTGLDVPHMVLMMEAAKVYADFGNHPGKDRIPREAAADGCVVITNRRGAAAFREDVPIPEQYKVENPTNQQTIEELNLFLHDICDHFADRQQEFEEYRTFIAGEKDKFKEDTEKLLGKLIH